LTDLSKQLTRQTKTYKVLFSCSFVQQQKNQKCLFFLGVFAAALSGSLHAAKICCPAAAHTIPSLLQQI
jgi:hypothetical protein